MLEGYGRDSGGQRGLRRKEVRNTVESISIMPEPFFLGPINVGLSVVMGWCVLGALLLVLLFLHSRVARFKQEPKGLQLALELLVSGMHRFAESRVGAAAPLCAPMVMTFMVYVAANSLVEMFGLPPATDDINCTLALGLMAFGLTNVTALRVKGFKGRIKNLAHPMPAVMPIRMLTDCITPLSMAIRLFANITAGGIIMKLVYDAAPFLVPAVLGVYFNILHVAIQTFVFGMLPLLYIAEAIE